MTSEEAKSFLIAISYKLGNMAVEYLTEKDGEKMREAIKVLEQQPCEDTEVIKVSKGAVKARQGRFVIYDVEWLKENFYTTEEKIYGQPKQPCEDCISRQAVDELSKELVHTTRDKADFLCNFWEGLRKLPPVTPERPKGKWIMHENHRECSECKTWFLKDMPRNSFCPNCGSYNGGGEDEDGKSL